MSERKEEIRDMFNKWARCQEPEPPEDMLTNIASFADFVDLNMEEIQTLFTYSYWDGEYMHLKDNV